MGYIITIARQFSSGGRELGRRLADELGIAYYDKEILADIQKKTPYSLSYIEEVSENRPILLPPINYGNSFSLYTDVSLQQNIDVHTAQNNIIREYVEKSNCVIIGRGADYTLRDKKPFRIFVYADMESRIKRAVDRREIDPARAKQAVIKTDKNRANYYSFYSGQKWGQADNFDLCINSTKLTIEQAVDVIAGYVDIIS